MDKDNGMLWSRMCSLIEILCVLEEKISLNCWQLQHDVPVTEIFEFNPLSGYHADTPITIKAEASGKANSRIH